MKHDAHLNEGYELCRQIAKREAKNFYYAFVALPEPRRNAICAIYAFMRHADDMADDESLPRLERRRRLDAWLSNWRGVCHGGDSSNLVFLAVRDAVERYDIPLNLLEELVAGVTMDLDSSFDSCHSDHNNYCHLDHTNNCHPDYTNNCHPERSAAESKDLRFAPLGAKVRDHEPDTYATFADLYRYCYLVASVVGLVCIRIFGYSDPRAEKLAEETGIAFQLTNILRDVAEDAERNRVYLPMEDLAAHNVSLDSLLHRAPGTPPTASERALLGAIGGRAEDFYKSAQKLLPLIDRESRPALWVLVSIYHGLLNRIERADYDVFTQRASVPMPQKIVILLMGIARIGLARLFA